MLQSNSAIITSRRGSRYSASMLAGASTMQPPPSHKPMPSRLLGYEFVPQEPQAESVELIHVRLQLGA